MSKTIETSKGLWQVVEINTYQEGQYYVDTIGSCYYKLYEITEEEGGEIVSSLVKNNESAKSYVFTLHSLFESQGIEITNNTYIFKV